MKLFECQYCGQPLYFENTRCESCGHRLGFLPAQATMTALEPEEDAWRALAEPKALYRFCANAEHEACNWLIPAAREDIFCAACRHNRTIPDLTQGQNLLNWRKIEVAKHRLLYTLLRLRLPLTAKPADPDGLAFDFLAAPAGGPVMTGHAGGVITINIAEADDAERERQRNNMAEPYRTLLGHFRHEIAHYYWDHLIKDTPRLAEFRKLFGDEREDYQAALQRHYADGPPEDWREHFISAYAASHPWEDFAETWAHYLHMVDTLETANAFGLHVRPRVTMGADLAAKIDFDPYRAPIERIVDAWLPLTFAVNSINRSMGVPDLYPFVLSPPVLVKLSFLHDCISQAEDAGEAGALRAVAAGLKRPVGTPDVI
ncbi:MAG TPA: putative zinc-binding peptidase [Pseudolabrys sp.]|nr:putative zinc-binding peptidase [Pseudolabrys sp.]